MVWPWIGWMWMFCWKITTTNANCSITAPQAKCVAIAGCCYTKATKDGQTSTACFAYRNDDDNICKKDEVEGYAVEECECFAEKITAFISAIIFLAFIFWVEQISVLNTYFMWYFILFQDLKTN